jgi:hypothetical protein
VAAGTAWTACARDSQLHRRSTFAAPLSSAGSDAEALPLDERPGLHERPVAPLRVRGLDRVRLHADLTILAKLARALSRARAVSLAA